MECMNPLILDSLQIHGFRIFRHLQVDRLGLVNLVGGKNNVGKSCLLEALYLYAHRGSPLIIQLLLETRDEDALPPSTTRTEETRDKLVAARHLFHGRLVTEKAPEPIEIGPINSPGDTLSMAWGWYTERFDETGQKLWQLLEPGDYDEANNLVPGLHIQMGGQRLIHVPLAGPRHYTWFKSEAGEIHCTLVSADRLNEIMTGALWDGIALTNLERDVLDSLHIIAPNVERVNLLGNTGLGLSRGRIPMVKIKDLSEPIPLRSMGEGMIRLFGIALALVNAGDGMLLIDEVDSGLHYSVQSDMWRLIFQVARRLNVQVFATTHSWDCIEAFQQVSQESKQGEGLYIRLEDKQEKVVATLFDERQLGIATREEIEVR